MRQGKSTDDLESRCLKSHCTLDLQTAIKRALEHPQRLRHTLKTELARLGDYEQRPHCGLEQTNLAIDL